MDATRNGWVIRRIRSDEGERLRQLRLRSLAEAPEAFGQVVEDVAARPALEWVRDARRGSSGDERAWFVCEVDAELIGQAHARRRRPWTVLVFNTWVARDARHLGIGRALIEAAEDWARAWGATETVLWVFERNVDAIAFYAHLGFTVDDGGADADAGAQHRALAMRHRLEPGSHTPR